MNCSNSARVLSAKRAFCGLLWCYLLIADFSFHPRKRTTVADESKRQQRMRLVQPDEEAPYEDVSFEEPENKLTADLDEARRYAELDRLLYRVLQLHSIHERRIASESTENGPSLQRQLHEAQRRLDQIFDEMR